MFKNMKGPYGKKGLMSLKKETKNVMAITESYYLKNEGNKMECCKP